MYNYQFFVSRLRYFRAILPYITIRKLFNLIISAVCYFFNLKRASSVPPVWIIILTYRCNYQCIMCQKSSLDDNPYKKPKSMDFVLLEEILRENHKDIFLVQLLGGEPMYYDRFTDVLKLLKELKIAYCITTNGSLLNAEIAEQVAGNCSWISFSLDAADPDLYRSIRKGGSIYAIARNIINLNNAKERKKTCLPLLNASATMFTYNLYDLRNLLNFCFEHSIRSLSISGGKLYNTKLVGKEHLLRNVKEEAIEIIENARRNAEALGITLRIALRSLYGNPTERKTPRKRTYNTRLDLFYEVTVQPDFTVVSAGDDYKCMGTLKREGISEIWNGHEYKVARDCNP